MSPFADDLAKKSVARVCLTLIVVTLFGSVAEIMAERPPMIIAHRGASGYLPEHTLEAKALAYGMGADFLEQDVVLTRDNRAVVLHDIHLDTVTDVAQRFPDRSRPDGRFYVLDFTLAEIRQLQVHERTAPGDDQRPVFPNRFPPRRSRFSVATLAEEIEFIQGLNRTTGRNVGLYPEIKQPAWHRRQGYDLSRVVVEILREYSFHDVHDRIYLQCFDADELRRLRDEFQVSLPLVQLIGSEDQELITSEGLRRAATYARAIGPTLELIYTGKRDGRPQLTDLVALARRQGLEVHPYTFRADQLPVDVDSFEDLLEIFQQAGVDALFTDFPDRCVRYFARGD